MYNQKNNRKSAFFISTEIDLSFVLLLYLKYSIYGYNNLEKHAYCIFELNAYVMFLNKHIFHFTVNKWWRNVKGVVNL